MGGPCSGTCQVGRTRDGKEFRAVTMHRGRPPTDPETGKRYPAGSYGPYCRCKTCGIWIIWAGPRCPCCARTLARKPLRSRVTGRAKYSRKVKDALGGAA